MQNRRLLVEQGYPKFGKHQERNFDPPLKSLPVTVIEDKVVALAVYYGPGAIQDLYRCSPIFSHQTTVKELFWSSPSFSTSKSQCLIKILFFFLSSIIVYLISPHANSLRPIWLSIEKVWTPLM